MSPLTLCSSGARFTLFVAFPAAGEFRLNSCTNPPRQSPFALRLSFRECS
jgi:hypothetical protein